MYNPKEFWNEYGNNKDISSNTPSMYFLTESIRRYIKDSDKLLDIGSGCGRVYKRIKSIKKCKIDMCDISESFIEKCYENTGVEPTLLTDEATMPYRDAEYNMVISFMVMLHIKPENIIKFLAEHIRVSKRFLFINTYYTTKKEPLAGHCFLHDYPQLFNNKLRILEGRQYKNKSASWLLEKI